MTLTQEITFADVMFRAFNINEMFSKVQTQTGGNFNNINKDTSISEASFERFVKVLRTHWTEEGNTYLVGAIYDNHYEKTCYIVDTETFVYLPEDFDSEEEFLNALSYLIKS